MTTFKSTFCRICEPHCALRAELRADGSIAALHPHGAHPAGGIACHKGLGYLQVHYDPDRLNWPRRRLNSRLDAHARFADASWEQALADIGQRLRAIRSAHGADAVAVYSGKPAAFDCRGQFYTDQFQKAINTCMRFSCATQNGANKASAASAIYGGPVQPVPDLYHTDYLLCLGANPRVSRWTGISVPNDAGQCLQAIEARGGKLRFVNPRITESAPPGLGETLQIRPDTDVYLLAAVLQALDQQGGFAAPVVAQYGKHMAQLRQFIGQYPAARVAAVTGIAAPVIHRLAAELSAAPSAAVYMSTGVNQGRQGVLCAWLVEMLNFVSGNLGRRGGTYLPTGFSPRPRARQQGAQRLSTSLGELQYGAAPGAMALPATRLAELISNGDIRALIVVAANPLLSSAGEARLREAFAHLDLLVTLDILPSATAELADYALPACDWLERRDINLAASQQQLNPCVLYTDAVEAPAEGRRNDWWILNQIAKQLGVELVDEQQDPEGLAPIAALLAAANVSLEQLQRAPQQCLKLPEEPRAQVYEYCLLHSDQRIDCCPPQFAEAGLLERCASIFSELEAELRGGLQALQKAGHKAAQKLERRREPLATLKLISLRTHYMHNSSLANMPALRQGLHVTNPLHMCAEDARARGLFEGDAIRVFNAHGSVETRVRISQELRPGVVALSHGYGNQHSYSLHTAAHQPGVNYNRLVPSGVGVCEPLSNMSWLCGVPVEVEKLLQERY